MTGNELKAFIRKHGAAGLPVYLNKGGFVTMYVPDAVYELTVNQYGGGFGCHIRKEHRTSLSAGIHGTPCDVLRFIAGRVLYGEVTND
jgi:hypothetical protein